MYAGNTNTRANNDISSNHTKCGNIQTQLLYQKQIIPLIGELPNSVISHEGHWNQCHQALTGSYT